MPDLSGFPMLTPLPTYSSQLVDEYYSYTSSPVQNIGGFVSTMAADGFHDEGRLTPQTPDQIIYHEPTSMEEPSEQYVGFQAWSDSGLMSFWTESDPNTITTMPTEAWPTPEPGSMLPMAQFDWTQPPLLLSPPYGSAELGSLHLSVPSLSASECSSDEHLCSAITHEEHVIYQPVATDMRVANMITSAPFMHDVNLTPNHPPLWVEGLISGSFPY